MDDVERILDHRTLGQSKKNRRTEFLVLWKGKLEADATWERDVSLWQFERQIEDYLTNSTRTLNVLGGGGLLAP